MRYTNIRELIEKTYEIDPASLGTEHFTYVDIASVDREVKRITKPQQLLVSEAPSRARKHIRANDVLVSTVRPNLNAVALVPSDYHDQIASTGFCVLRANTAEVGPEYLFYFTQTDDFINHLTTFATGASYPAVTDDDILDCEIPLPSPAEQRRVAAILRAADDERQRRRYTQTLSDGLLEEMFVQVFGDPVTNPMGWEVKELGTFIEFVTSGSRGWAKHYSDSGARFIRVQNLHDHRLDLDDIAYVRPPQSAEAVRTRVQPNDILLAITGATIGLCAIVPEGIGESYVSQHVAIIRLGAGILPVFASSFISHPRGGQMQIGAINYGDTKPGLGLDQIRDLDIMCPPPQLQCRFAEIVAQYEHMRWQQEESARQSDHLFDTLLHRAFVGEL